MIVFWKLHQFATQKGKRKKERMWTHINILPHPLFLQFNMIKDKVQQLNKELNIEDEIIGVRFSNQLLKNSSKDTACTALARAIINRTRVVFSTQLCEGGNFFLNLTDITKEQTCDVYVNKEQVFKNKQICCSFLNKLPKFKFKSVIIEPVKENSQVVILLLNPAQIGRIIGLLNYSQYQTIEILPNQPTCICLFTPLITKKPHINFMDYYDRYYQGKGLWNDNKMILSLRMKDFNKILKNLDSSAQGSFKPDLSPKEIDPI